MQTTNNPTITARLRLWTACGLLLHMAIATLAACTVSRPRTAEQKVLVSEEDPIFDKRFRALRPADLNLSRFWTEGKPVKARQPVPLTHTTIAEMAEQFKDGVVNIYTRRVEEHEAKFGISPNDLLPIRIPIVSSILDIIPFQVPIPFRTEGVSLGSGFIVNTQGYILTNAHVINNATDIRIILSRGRGEYTAKIIGIDRLTDTALLKIDVVMEDLSVLPLGDSEAVMVGERVIAVGNPLGLRHTVTSGLVSAKERLIPQAQNQLLDFIQTDTAINPGSSGGPLLNFYGEVVGINTAIITEAQLIGFAIPINTVKEMLPMLVLGQTERGWLGGTAGPMTYRLAAEMNYPHGEEGAFVIEVAKDSPAEKAGLMVKDIITHVNGQKIDHFLLLRRKLLGLGPGQTARFTVFRQGNTLEIEGILGRKTEDTP